LRQNHQGTKGYITVFIHHRHGQPTTPHNKLEFNHTGRFLSPMPYIFCRPKPLHSWTHTVDCSPCPCLLSCRGRMQTNWQSGTMQHTPSIYRFTTCGSIYEYRNKFRSTAAAHGSSSSVARESILSQKLYSPQIMVRCFSLVSVYYIYNHPFFFNLILQFLLTVLT
jgi:hypothetical protein